MSVKNTDLEESAKKAVLKISALDADPPTSSAVTCGMTAKDKGHRLEGERVQFVGVAHDGSTHLAP